MKEKILDYIKTNLKVLPVTLLFCAASVSATSLIIDSRTIAYNDEGNVSNVKEALDTLYDSVEVTTLIPVGGVLPYMGTTAPTNYLICDGTEYNIADYKKLADHIKNNFGSYNFFGGNGTTTFKVPDLRGEFLRGSGTNSHEGQGNGSTLGEHQDATEIPQAYVSNNVLYSAQSSPINPDSDVAYSVNRGYIKVSLESGYGFKYTSRPTNTSVNYIIKVK